MAFKTDFPPISANFEQNSKAKRSATVSSLPPLFKGNVSKSDGHGTTVWKEKSTVTTGSKSFAQILQSSTIAPTAESFCNVNKSLVDGANGTREIVQPKSFTMIDGKRTLIFNEEECIRLDARLDKALICKFPSVIPNFTYVKNAFERLKLKGRYSFGPLGPRHLLVNLVLEEDYSRLWHNGTLKFLGIANGTIFKWTPEFEIDKEPPTVPIWVALPNLPLRFCHRECFMEIGKFFGKPLRIDDGAALLSRPALPRILVEANLLAPKLEHIQLASTRNGTNSLIQQKVIYENWPAYCSKCCLVGHDSNSCAKENGSAPTNDLANETVATFHNQRAAKTGTLSKSHNVNKEVTTKATNKAEGSNSFKVLDIDAHEPTPSHDPIEPIIADSQKGHNDKNDVVTDDTNEAGDSNSSKALVIVSQDHSPAHPDMDKQPDTVISATAQKTPKRIIPTPVESAKPKQPDEEELNRDRATEEESHDVEENSPDKEKDCLYGVEDICTFIRSLSSTEDICGVEQQLAIQMKDWKKANRELVEAEIDKKKKKTAKKERKAAAKKSKNEEESR